jgi:hypothetical protein
MRFFLDRVQDLTYTKGAKILGAHGLAVQRAGGEREKAT